MSKQMEQTKKEEKTQEGEEVEGKVESKDLKSTPGLWDRIPLVIAWSLIKWVRTGEMGY